MIGGVPMKGYKKEIFFLLPLVFFYFVLRSVYGRCGWFACLLGKKLCINENNVDCGLRKMSRIDCFDIHAG